MMRLVKVIRRLSLAASALLLSLEPAAAQAIPGMTEAQTFAVIAAALVLICAAFGGYMIYAGLANRKLAKASETWPTSGGEVLASEVAKRISHSRKNRTTYYAPQIRYGYRAGGTDYEGSVIRFGDLERSSTKLPQELVTKYPAGATVAVRYDPSDPSRATLESESEGGRQVVVGSLFIAVPLLIVIAAGAILGLASGGPNLPPEVLEELNNPSQP
jgi:hypothetical protein